MPRHIIPEQDVFFFAPTSHRYHQSQSWQIFKMITMIMMFVCCSFRARKGLNILIYWIIVRVMINIEQLVGRGSLPPSQRLWKVRKGNTTQHLIWAKRYSTIFPWKYSKKIQDRLMKIFMEIFKNFSGKYSRKRNRSFEVGNIHELSLWRRSISDLRRKVFEAN